MIIAYIDPGSGALLMQTIIAAVVGSSLYFRKKIAGLFRRGAETQQGQPGQAAANPSAGTKPQDTSDKNPAQG
jgi:hypothetical protein